jgi:hypothetical protein
MRDIDQMLTLDERSSADFILSLRKRWADTVYPAFISEFENSGKKVRTPKEGEKKLKMIKLYPWFSHLERIGQKTLCLDVATNYLDSYTPSRHQPRVL